MAKVVLIGNVASSIFHFRGKLLEEMVSKGHQLVACAPDPPGEASERLRLLGVRYLQYPLDRAGINPLFDLRSLHALVGVFLQERPDIVLAYTIKPVIYGSIGAAIARVPLVSSMITGLGYSFSGKSLKRLLINRVAKILYSVGLQANKILFFQNPDDLRTFQSMQLIKEHQRPVLINGSGVDLEFFSPRPLPPSLSFLLIARLIEEKGIRDYVAAARIVKAKYPEVKFRLVGIFNKNPTAIRPEELKSWEKEGVVEFLGSKEDIRPAMEDASVYVLPSFYREGTPRSILEALSMGRAVITTDAPGCRETVISGINGYLVPVRRPDVLAQAMEQFMEKPERVAEMGQASRRLAEEKFDVRVVNRIILENLGLYDEKTA